MALWREDTLARVTADGPLRVKEPGCGTRSTAGIRRVSTREDRDNISTDNVSGMLLYEHGNVDGAGRTVTYLGVCTEQRHVTLSLAPGASNLVQLLILISN